jgi:1,6-anhydro-N-acetylmuramate kinase
MTRYSNAGVEALLLEQLQRATEQAVQQSAFAANERAREYLRSGVGRRLRVLHRTLSNMFELFPVSTAQPVDRDDSTTPRLICTRSS